MKNTDKKQNASSTPDSSTLFDSDQPHPEDASSDPSEKKEKKNSRRRDHNPRPSNVTRIRTKLKELAPEDLICKCCGEQLIKVNEVVLHSRYDHIPASTRIEDLVEDIYACPGCAPAVVSAANFSVPNSETQACDVGIIERTAFALDLAQWLGTPALTDDTHSQIIDDAVATGRSGMFRSVAQIARSKASPSMLSYIAVSKYCDHLPAVSPGRDFRPARRTHP